MLAANEALGFYKTIKRYRERRGSTGTKGTEETLEEHLDTVESLK